MPYYDLREFLERLEDEGQLRRVRKQVDWNLELAHVAKLNEEKPGGGYALLFENIKDYPGHRVLTSALTARERLAYALEMPADTSLMNLSRLWVERIKDRKVPPVEVSRNEAPCKENVITGDDVDVTMFPAPWFYPLDGGRYIGTAGGVVTRNLETGRLNVGTYRCMIVDEKRITTYFIKAKDGEMDFRGYAERGIPMPVALVIGSDPNLFLCSSTMFPLAESEYEVVGALRGEPLPVVKAETSDLLVPATAEIVIEGEIVPGERLPEGPFGEYTGHYSGKGSSPYEFMHVKAITFRNNPILWATTVGRPVTDTHMVMAVNRTASLWNDLQRMGIPGIKAVYGPPAAAGRMLVIISMKPMYHGHSTQVGLAAFATHTGNYGLKTVILVDDDIDPENMEQVMYALSFKFQPEFGTQFIHRGRSTPLDPSLPRSARFLTSRVIIDCTTPYEWDEDERPLKIELDEQLVKHIQENWDEYFAEPAELPERLEELVPA
ncbi:MAG: UbiD family decarboxylase [Chloroflexi bacterium]|nr:MAG: UbiD family decarboxylase [Chloroflexota bacterium]